MHRVLLAAVVLVGLICNPSYAADVDEATPLVGRIANPTHAVVRLIIRPMPAPTPALKYQLLPEVRELNPGNPAQNYLKCFAEQQGFFYGKGAASERASYLAMPLAELPADKLRDYGGNALRQADWAARLDTPDWQVLQHVQSDGLDLLLPELEPLRVLATALQVRFRGEVAGRRFDDALRAAKTMFALARHLGEYPAEAANLAGLSIADQALDTLQEMIQQPGCPNLYWALTDLPCPLVELRKGLQGNRAVVAADLRPLRDDVPMTEAELEKAVGRLSGVINFGRQQAGEPPRSLRTALAARIGDAERVRAARGRLVVAGGKEELIAKFPPLQVVLLDEKREYEVQRDERNRAPRSDGLFADLLPDILKIRQALGRLEQRIALLRHVEALRQYAAAHDGQLPAKLAETTVPLPDDPFTAKPFAYKVEAATAHLGRYEVTVQK